jgi:hypothetical protein
LLTAGEQERPEAAADRRQDHVVHGAAKLSLDQLHIIQRRPDPGETPFLADRPAQRRTRSRPRGRGQFHEAAHRVGGLTDSSAGMEGRTAQREGLAEREDDIVQDGFRGQLERRRLPARGTVIGGGGRRGLGREVENYPVKVGAGDPVDHAMVHLGDQGPAAIGESFDDPVLPQRMIAVQALGHHPRHQLGELPVSAGRRQGGPPDVVPKVEVRVVDPDWPSEPERNRVQFLPVARHQRQTRGQESQELLMGGRGTLEHRNRCDRHRRMRILVLGIDEQGV